MANKTLTGKNSPWGKIQGYRDICEGVQTCYTAGHGGVKLDRKRNAAVPAPWRLAGGWYEEDCDYCIPILVHADAILQNASEGDADLVYKFAPASAIDWFPDFYEAWTGQKIPVGESKTRRDAEFVEENRDNFVVYSAIGKYDGTVFCHAVRASDNAKKSFYVDQERYSKRNVLGHVIDPMIDREVVFEPLS